MILDEATSALDTRSEALVQQAPTRLSTLRSADRIVVMGEGRILETGTDEELLRGGGA